MITEAELGLSGPKPTLRERRAYFEKHRSIQIHPDHMVTAIVALINECREGAMLKSLYGLGLTDEYKVILFARVDALGRMLAKHKWGRLEQYDVEIFAPVACACRLVVEADGCIFDDDEFCNLCLLQDEPRGWRLCR